MEVDTFCVQHAVVAVPWHVQKVIVRSDLAGEAEDSGWTQTNTVFYLGTERTAINGLVPFLPVPQGRIGLRHALNTGCCNAVGSIGLCDTGYHFSVGSIGLQYRVSYNICRYSIGLRHRVSYSRAPIPGIAFINNGDIIGPRYRV